MTTPPVAVYILQQEMLFSLSVFWGAVHELKGKLLVDMLSAKLTILPLIFA